MKFCVITPIGHLDLSMFGSGIHMALTHLIARDESYTQHYKRVVTKGEYVILDNSAFELEKEGKGLDPEPVLKAAKAIGASEVIATDVLLKGPETVASTRNFIKEYNKFFSEEMRFNRPVPKIMAVPQGSSADEWLDSYLQLLVTPGVNVVGFSKIAVPVSFGGSNARKTSGGVTKARLALYNILSTKKLWPHNFESAQMRNVEVHLLGGDNHSGFELSEIANLPVTKEVAGGVIRSNDTSAPVWYGANGVAFDPITGKAPELIFEKPDLENERQTTGEAIKANYSTILKNIAVFHKMANNKGISRG